MVELNINSDLMISKGMSVARSTTKPFLPGAGEFCSWCLPTAEDAGMPRLEDAFTEAREQAGRGLQVRNWSHPAVYKAATETNLYELKTVANNDPGYRALRKRFEDHYADLTKKVLAGEMLQVNPENRIAPQKVKQTPRSKDAGEKTLNNLMGMFDD